MQLEQTLLASQITDDQIGIEAVQSAQGEVSRYQELEVIPEEEYLGSEEVKEELSDDIVEIDGLQNLVLNADLVNFGPDLEDVKHMIELPEEQQRYDLVTQVNDMMDDMLSVYSLDKRSKGVLNAIHTTIERYKQLRQDYSVRNNEGMLSIPVPITDDRKPLVDRLTKHNEDISWLIPVTKAKKVLYNLRMLDIDSNNDVIQSNDEASILEYYDLWDEYYSNKAPISQNKYVTLHNRLDSFTTPIINDGSIQHLQSLKIKGRQHTVLNNYLNFKSTTISNNTCETPPVKNLIGETLNFLHNMPFYTTVLTEGQTYKEKDDLMKSDVLDVRSFLMLPYPYVRFSRQNLFKTSIYERAHLCNHYPSLYRLLTKRTPISSKTITPDSVYTEEELKTLFSQLNHMPPSGLIMDMDEKDRYSFYLNKVIPKNDALFKMMRSIMEDSLSYYDVVKQLEVFYIYEENVTVRLLELIKDYLIKKIKANKIQIRERQRAFQKLAIKQSKRYLNLSLIDVLSKEVEDVLKLYYLSKDVNETSSEQLSRIMHMDSGRLYHSGVLLQMLDLHAVEKLDKTIQDKSLELNEKLAKTKTKCSKYVLVKKYMNIEQLEADQNKQIYVDKEYDQTKYNLLDHYLGEKESMELKEFMVFLAERLMQEHYLTQEEATIETQAILKGKRLVENGTYAVLIVQDSGITGTQYYKRTNDAWIVDKSIDENVFALTSEDFCNTNDSCTFNNNECLDVNTIKQQHNKQLIDRIVSQMKTEYYLSKQDLEQFFKHNYNDNFRGFRLLQEHTNRVLFEYDMLKRNIAIEMEEGEDVIESPYKSLMDTILSEGDVTKKYEYILEFVQHYTRLPNTAEQKTWFYCKESNVPLLPMFYYSLASAYKNQSTYEDALAKIVKNHGVVSDNYIVDKHSGYVIAPIQFNTEEGYTVDGFKEVTRDLLSEEEKVTVASEEVLENIPNTEETKMMYNIIHTLNSHMGIRMSMKDVNLVVIQSNEFFSNALETEEQYEVRFKLQAKKGKDLPKYDEHKDFLLLLYTTTILFTVIQTKFINEQIKKSVPGCLKSLSGYPLDLEDTKYKGLNYIACVVHKLKSSITPWYSIGKLKATTLVKKMKIIIDSSLLESNYLRERRELFEQMQKKQVLFKDIPDELNVKTWKQFVPPLYAYTIHQPDPIASHVKKSLLVNKDGYSIIHLKMVQMAYRIMHHINSTVSNEIPHFMGEDGPYKDNTCCEVLIKDFTSSLDYFVSKKPDIGKNILSHQELGVIKDRITALDKPLYIINDLGFTKIDDANVVIFSESVIYKAFMYYCKINKEVNIDPMLKMICIDNKSAYTEEDSIEVKISKMKQEGKMYSIESLYQLMQVVNSKNIIYISNSFSGISRYHMLEETLQELELNNNTDIPVDIQQSLKMLMDTFDITIESKTKDMITIDRLIKTEWKQLEKQIIKLKKICDKKEKKILDMFIRIVNNDHSANLQSYIMYIKEFIVGICKKFPQMIINKSDFQTIPIPKHWKITSFNHKMDLIQSVGKYYKSFMEFYNDEDIDKVLNLILESTDNILSFMNALPYFSSYTDEEQVKHFHVIDETMIENLYNYLLMKTLTMYIDKIDQVTSTHGGLGAAQEEDIRIVLARKKTVQQSINSLLITYIKHFNEHYEKSEPVYTEIKKRTLYAKEKEKIELVQYMSEMSDEQRNAEQALRATGQGRWATGQQKGYKEYQGSTYDEETREAREAAGTIDFTGEYMREEMETDVDEETGFDEEADALYMGNIMEDDDNDEGGEYTLDPVDND